MLKRNRHWQTYDNSVVLSRCAWVYTWPLKMGNTGFVFISNLHYRCVNIALQYTLFHSALERNASLQSLQLCNYPIATEYGNADINWTRWIRWQCHFVLRNLASKYDPRFCKLKWGIFYFRTCNSTIKCLNIQTNSMVTFLYGCKTWSVTRKEKCRLWERF